LEDFVKSGLTYSIRSSSKSSSAPAAERFDGGERVTNIRLETELE
jgi:hypothetical protein